MPGSAGKESRFFSQAWLSAAGLYLHLYWQCVTPVSLQNWWNSSWILNRIVFILCPFYDMWYVLCYEAKEIVWERALGQLGKKQLIGGKEVRPRWKPMKARYCLDESIRESFSIPKTWSVTGRAEPREVPQSWGARAADGDKGSPGLQQGNLALEIQLSSPKDRARVVLCGQKHKEGTKELACFGFGRLKRDNLPRGKSWSREKSSNPSPMCSVRAKLQQRRLRLRRGKAHVLQAKLMMSWEPGALCSAQHCRKRLDEHFLGMTQVE